MPNNLFNRFGRNNNQPNNQKNNIISQLAQIKRNPAAILDILLNNGKINQQQYAELQQYKNDPQKIFNYLSQHGNSEQLNYVANQIGKIM